MADPKPQTYTLYHNYYSICSIMVCYTLALSGPPKDSTSQIVVQQKGVDIFQEEQLTEEFLCEINAKGQVPVLTSPSLPKPITDSLEITHYLATLYPSLIPSTHATQITKMLKDLHSLNYFSLSFPGKPQVAQGFKMSVLKRLGGEMGPVSERYRRALEYKMTVIEGEKINGLKPEAVVENVEKARSLMKEFESHLSPESANVAIANGTSNVANGPWLFGLDQPTALDAHLIVFIARMRDIGRGDELIPGGLGRYADLAMQRVEWDKTMQGRITMIGVPRTSGIAK